MQIGNLIIRDVHARSVDIVLFRAQDSKVRVSCGSPMVCVIVALYCTIAGPLSGYVGTSVVFTL